MTTMTNQTRAGALLATANINEAGNDTFAKMMSGLSTAVYDGTTELDENSVIDMLESKGADLYAGFEGLSDFVGNVADALDTIEYGTRRATTNEVDNIDKLKKLLKGAVKQLEEFNDELKKAKEQIDV